MQRTARHAVRYRSPADPERIELATMNDTVLRSCHLSQPRVQTSIELQNVTNPNWPLESVARRRLSPNYANNLSPKAEVVTKCMLSAGHPSSIAPPGSLPFPSRRFSPFCDSTCTKL